MVFLMLSIRSAARKIRSPMKRDTAYAILGAHSAAEVARMLNMTRQAVRLWPEKLPRSVADRVIAARQRIEWREHIAAYGEDRVNIPAHIRDMLDEGT